MLGVATLKDLQENDIGLFITLKHSNGALQGDTKI